LAEAPRATDEASTCSYAPAKGLSFVDVYLHESGRLAATRGSDSHKTALSLPESGKDALVNPKFHEYADLYAEKGKFIVRVTVPMGPESVATVKAIARKALVRP
jgi:hypothetical protein